MTEWVFFLQLSPSRFVDLDDAMVIAPAIENHAHSDVDRFFFVSKLHLETKRSQVVAFVVIPTFKGVT